MANVRDLKELNPLVTFLAEKALEDIRKQGVNPLVVETYRPQSRQNQLYAQGRTKPGNRVTWTKNSFHTSRKALDIVPQRSVNGKMTAIWNAKDPDFVIIINTMIAYGFEAGHNWTNTVDSAHFQIDANITGSFSSGKTTREVTKMIQTKVGTKVDGVWGKDTTASVKAFQKLNGLIADGLVGLTTLRVLFEKKKSTANVPTTGVYIVKAGDTLSKIAYNNGVTVHHLAGINNITNPNLIKVGQKIELEKPRAHTVVKGDNLTKIALKYGTTVQALATKNNIKNTNIIRIGQIIKL